MEGFGQLALEGLLAGSVYSLIAVGFVLVYKASKVFNFATGELVMIGGMLFWFSNVQMGLNIWLSVAIALGSSVGLGLIIERLFMRPMAGQPIFSMVIMTLALSGSIKGLTILAFTATQRPFPQIFGTEMISWAGFQIQQQYLVSFLIAMGVFLAVYLFFRWSRWGLGMRATAEDQQVAESIGIPAERSFAISWALAGGVSAVAGLMLGALVGVSPGLGHIGLVAFAAVFFGGIESIAGALVGGLAIGLLQNIAGAFVDPVVGGGTRDIVPYVILLLVLIFRPYGLFGLKRIERL